MGTKKKDGDLDAFVGVPSNDCWHPIADDSGVSDAEWKAHEAAEQGVCQNSEEPHPGNPYEQGWAHAEQSYPPPARPDDTVPAWTPGNIPEVGLVVPAVSRKRKSHWWRDQEAFYHPQRGGGERVDIWDLKIAPGMYPRGSIYDKYFDACAAVTDVPVGHHWAALTTSIGAVLGPGHVLEHGEEQLAANLYTIIIAESGQRKSYSINLIAKLLPPGINTEQIPSSDAALVELIKEQPWMMLVLDEAGAIFGQLCTQWNSKFTHHLIRAYARQAITTRRIGRPKEGVAKLTSAQCEHIALLGATTQKQITNLPRRELDLVLEGGFLGRFMVCPGRPAAEESEEFPAPLTMDKEFSASLANWFMQLYMASPPKQGDGTREKYVYTLSTEAEAEMCNWIDQLGPSPTQAVGPLWSRLSMYCKKLALIYHVAQGRNWGDEINAATVVCAERAITEYLIPSYRYLTESAGRLPFYSTLQRVRELLRGSVGGISYKSLCTEIGLRNSERGDVMVALDPEVHYEMWQSISRDGTGSRHDSGRPHLVVVWGKEPLPRLNPVTQAPIRPDERRRDNGENMPPPPLVVRALLERGAEDPLVGKTEPDSMYEPDIEVEDDPGMN